LKEKLCKIPLLKTYIESSENKSEIFSNGLDNPDNPVFTSSNLTNLGVFRYYAEAYLRNSQFVDPTQTVILRHRTPDGNGLPLQVYVFTKNNTFAPYENIQSEIFEHLLAIMNEFGLKVYQQPTGEDLIALSKK